MGNPPYSGHSANKGKWMNDLLKKGYKSVDGSVDEGYYKVDGKPLGDKNPKWLQDDYVKFIRFAQWKIDQAGEGVLGFITNHSYLDNPTFRGMRQSLMNSFNEIYILDLHGNSLKKEKCPDGSKDENVFDIQQGVAIALFIKTPEKKENQIYHSDLWGLRDKKYNWLENKDIKTTEWKKLSPKSEFYLFVPRDEELLENYEKFKPITEIFNISSVGIVTARDKLTINWTPQETLRTISNFSKLDVEMARMSYGLGKDTRDWKINLAQQDLIDSGLDKNKIVLISYRPFDIRYTYYTGRSRGYHCMPRPEVMRHMLKENIGLVSVRQVAEGIFNHALPTNSIIESRMTLSNKGIAFLFPLYLYPDTEREDLFSDSEVEGRKPNFNPEFYKTLYRVYGKDLLPEEILHYIYSILYSNIYRTKYAEFLKTDFPRIPFTKDYEVFCKMAELGEKLINLHLIKSKELDNPIAKFQGKGDKTVEKISYKDEKVFINKTQYFEGVEQEVYEYQIGGYKVCNKWFKDRKRRVLSLKDIKHYCKVVTALKKTIEVQVLIDAIYSAVEREVIEINP